MTFQSKLRTRYADTAQDGIIHHPSFIIYLEVARLEFFKNMGCDISELEKQKIISPVVELSIQYLKPLYSSDDIIVQVDVKAFSKVRFSLIYQILKKGVCVATATTSHCFINESFKPIAIPQVLLKKFQELKPS